MARKDRRHGGPELDPFGTTDPAWERYEGVSWARKVAQSRALRSREGRRRRPKGEALTAMAVGVLGVAVAVGAIALVFWLLSLLFD